ncbi:MAG: anti-sigma regulatory factor [Leptolyngbyaceae bacterium]|nr:anti-sigma regulatory factor [Leptolyngbyaceae bacterium]
MRTELHVPSDLKFLNIVEHWLLGSLQAELGASADWAKHSNRLRLVLVEAYSNVVRHAHKDQPNLPVLMRLELKERNIYLEIWDYGRGYDLSTYLPPDPQELQEHGYGWLILNRLMDKVEYRLRINGRNCLKLETTFPETDFQDIKLGHPLALKDDTCADHDSMVQKKIDSTDQFEREKNHEAHRQTASDTVRKAKP